MRRAIVTGATGFIGRNLCKNLQDEGWQVIACGRKEDVGPWDQFIEWDVTDAPPSQPNDFKVDTFYHLASKAHALSEIGEDEDEYNNINVNGTQHALLLAKETGATRFIYFSSVKAMGEGNSDYNSISPIDESFACKPAGPYGLSKLDAEQLVFSHKTLFSTKVIRPCLVYGPASKGNLTRMAEAIFRNRFPPIPDFGNKRSVVHVSDLCRLAVLLATEGNKRDEIVIAAEPIAYSTRELQNIIRKCLGRTPPKRAVPIAVLRTMGVIGDIIGRIRKKRFVFDTQALSKISEDAYYNGTKATTELGFVYKHSLTTSASCLLEKMARTIKSTK